MHDRPLELNHVSKDYGRLRALDDLSLSVPAGCVYGFLGPNGAGKTTTIRIILDIIRPTRGTLSILGATNAFQVRDRLGYLPEEKGLYKRMTAAGAITFFGTLKGMSRSQARKRAYELLSQYGLQNFADYKTEALSKGMVQKVQVLAALVHDPELIILDEPFSGLDPVNQGVMEEVIDDLKRRGRTVLFSTHVMQHAERLCERLLIIASGRKVFDGTLDQARRTQSTRIRLRTHDNIGMLEEYAGIAQIESLGPSEFELVLKDGATVQAILEACFLHRVRIENFSVHEPSLHDVFVR